MSDDWEEGFTLEDREPYPPQAGTRPSPDEEEVNGLHDPSWRIRSKIYVWGYELPQSGVIQRQFQETEEARHFAAERGWGPTRADAWAKEIALPVPMSEGYVALAPRLRLDSSVVGCGGRKVSND